MRTSECRAKLISLAEAKGKLIRKLESCKPHEVTSIIMAEEAVQQEILRIGHELQMLQDRALQVCP